jgi:hypothetical protein
MHHHDKNDAEAFGVIDPVDTPVICLILIHAENMIKPFHSLYATKVLLTLAMKRLCHETLRLIESLTIGEGPMRVAMIALPRHPLPGLASPISPRGPSRQGHG